MINLDAIHARMAAVEARVGINPLIVDQGSLEWHRIRLGVITASEAASVVAKKDSQTRQNYLAQLCAEIAVGHPAEMLSTKPIEWGREHEGAAIQSYEFIHGLPVTRLGFLMSEDMRCGCSPDGIDAEGGFEVKCPWNSTNHVLAMVDGFVKPEWRWQIQFSLFVSGFDMWKFCSFDPRMRSGQLHVQPMRRDDAMQATLADAVPQFIADLDKMLAKIGFEFGQQWSAPSSH